MQRKQLAWPGCGAVSAAARHNPFPVFGFTAPCHFKIKQFGKANAPQLSSGFAHQAAVLLEKCSYFPRKLCIQVGPFPHPHHPSAAGYKPSWGFWLLKISLGSSTAANISSLSREIGEEQRGCVAKGNVSSEKLRKLAQTALPQVSGTGQSQHMEYLG